MPDKTSPERYAWCEAVPLSVARHDPEWGVPVYEDKRHVEFLIPKPFQAGLGWITILRKRNTTPLRRSAKTPASSNASPTDASHSGRGEPR